MCMYLGICVCPCLSLYVSLSVSASTATSTSMSMSMSGPMSTPMSKSKSTSVSCVYVLHVSMCRPMSLCLWRSDVVSRAVQCDVILMFDQLHLKSLIHVAESFVVDVKRASAMLSCPLVCFFVSVFVFVSSVLRAGLVCVRFVLYVCVVCVVCCGARGPSCVVCVVCGLCLESIAWRVCCVAFVSCVKSCSPLKARERGTALL